MSNLLSFAARMHYERSIETFRTRLITIDTKEKSKFHQAEITSLKMIIVLLSNLLKDSK
ncbi:hypothetical protein [Sulfuricurvum sp.]|uniref:hypothetical protein n=1 Tax=Sulfuricurvum sp. TaxID=2025608 RepID=UPI003564734E